MGALAKSRGMPQSDVLPLFAAASRGSEAAGVAPAGAPARDDEEGIDEAPDRLGKLNAGRWR
jgi:hypothetical protein